MNKFYLLASLCVFIGLANHALAQDFSPYEEAIPGSDQQIEMVPIEGGTFLMGSPREESGREEDEGPQKKVRVNPFWMAQYEVTWQEYDLFVEEKLDDVTSPAEEGEVAIQADAVSLPTPPYIDMSFGMGRDGFPAINMTQYAAVMYAKWLTAETGHFYRLPTEAEWEYACRAGSQSAYSYGEDPEELDKYAWYEDNSTEKYHKIGMKEPNAFELYDIHGNVAEWTMDQYKANYFDSLEGEEAENPWFRPDELYPRSVRGGSWQDDPSALRCAARRGSKSRWKQRDPQLPKSLWWLTDASFVGFRLVRPKNPPSKEEIEKYWLEAIEDI
ncbi:formylglycine-generating enzyme family protein [Fodinibius salsisoli]|uniref:SUMF1/EgtB/PvdO family nonheme iron enzyme n=1 Tax=Fodinibius salsisoli TaxID=2820877 RepID=A0ABT3PKG7_9BACT|nr:SUMF1/EgtB/PvdO family nonheme iron enzyme [Fodinibius salsisoli]MCW9706360.1 SUMF1/EgtB/PvdO family nonheme iron enzyme [Fodinibius salsisoli]